MSSGSNWHIWDLHLHTPHSILNNGFGNPDNKETWEKYVTEIEKQVSEKNFVSIGVTDYFTIEGYKQLLQYQQKGRLQNILLIPNIEFRIDQVIIQSMKGTAKRINLHVLFSPEIPPKEIEEGFLHDLDFMYENEPFDDAKTRKLKISNLEDFGESLRKEHKDFGKYSPFEVGCMTAVVRSDKLKKPLDTRFKGDYLLVLSEEGLSLGDWNNQYHAVRKQLYQMSHAIFSSNVKTREFCLGKTHPTPQAFIDEFKSYKPCIWGCDSHSLSERFLEPDLNRYCWIKGEVTWEGLKQILCEPEHRVRIQKDNPEPDKSIYTIDEINIRETNINDVLSLSDFHTKLNPNLITIIGGRGSGKTALLDIIACIFKEGEKLTSMEKSFYHRLYVGYGTEKHLSNVPIEVEVGFRSGEKYPKVIGKDTTYFEKTNIIYLTQDHFDEFSANPDKLNSHVIDLVFERFVEEKSRYLEMDAAIMELEQDIQRINLEIQQLRDDISGGKELEETNRNQKIGEKADYLQRISNITATEQDSIDIIANLTRDLDNLRSKKRDIESLLYLLSEFSTEITSLGQQYRERANRINEDLTKLQGEESVQLFPNEIKEIVTIDEIISKDYSTLNVLLKKTEELYVVKETKINELEGISRVIADLHQKANDCSLEIQEIENRILLIEEKEKHIKTLDNERYEKYGLIMSQMIDQRIFLQSIISKFEEGKNEMLSNLSFTAIVDMKGYKRLLETLREKVDNRSHTEEGLKASFTPIYDLMNDIMNEENTVSNNNEVIALLAEFGKSLRLKHTTSDSDFYDALLMKFFTIGLKIKFSNKILSSLSMGERAVVLLKILLALDDKPLLIDQPEEHLDNRYIYDELMPAFRSAKTRRQIIIATHNANLVVNTDAEQIIIAQHTNGKLSYTVTTLEDLTKREEIKTVLEGGDEAFKNREMKYGYIF